MKLNDSSFKNKKPILIFSCPKCSKEFRGSFSFRRHMLEVELNLTENCPYCNDDFKRLSDHLPHCSSFKKSNSKPINNLIAINSSSTTFDVEKEYEIKKL